GRSSSPCHLDDAQIQRALAPPSTSSAGVPENTDGLFLASGAKQMTRLLRQRLQERKGYALLSAQSEPQLLIDFEHDLAVPLNAGASVESNLARQLGDLFDLLTLQ